MSLLPSDYHRFIAFSMLTFSSEEDRNSFITDFESASVFWPKIRQGVELITSESFVIPRELTLIQQEFWEEVKTDLELLLTHWFGLWAYHEQLRLFLTYIQGIVVNILGYETNQNTNDPQFLVSNGEDRFNSSLDDQSIEHSDKWEE